MLCNHIFLVFLLIASTFVQITWCRYPSYLKNLLSECRCESDNFEPFCQTNYHFYYTSRKTHIKSNNFVSYYGIPVKIKSCVCFFGPNGVGCTTNDDVNTKDFEKISWIGLKSTLSPHFEAARSDHLVDGQFVVTYTGRKSAHLQLSRSSNQSSSIFRFSLLPSSGATKSRVELSTCFVHENELMGLFNSPTLHPSIGTSLITYCRVANIPIKSLSTYQYEMYFPRSHFNQHSDFIITQWHGTPDPNIFQDKHGCVARLRDVDRFHVCADNVCDSGQVMDSSGDFLGLRYQAGGFPPLSVQVRNSSIIVVARSDERVFIPRGGCSLLRNLNRTNCPDHPRQQLHLLLTIKFDDFQFNSWNKFEWKIIWSRYTWMKSKHPRDGGQLTSNAWIRLKINEKQVVDWVGPCGRNDEGRVPFFKAGVYNPSCCIEPVMLYMKDYKHDYQLIKHINKQTEKKIKSLIIHEPGKRKFPNLNYYNSRKGFQKLSGSCILQAHHSHLADINNFNFYRLKVDKATKRFLKSLIKIIEKQNSRIEKLEKMINDRRFE